MSTPSETRDTWSGKRSIDAYVNAQGLVYFYTSKNKPMFTYPQKELPYSTLNEEHKMHFL